MALYAVVNRIMMQRLLRALTYLTGSMLLLGACFWALVGYGRWWALGLWALFLTVAVAVLVLGKARQPLRTLLPMTALSVFAGMLVIVGMLLLCFRVALSPSLLLALMAIAAGQLLSSQTATVQTYMSSLRHTKAHYLYLRANGASHLEALMPSVRRSLRAALMPSLHSWVQPLVVAPPMLLCGLLMAGMSLMAALVVTMLTLLASVVGSVVAAIVFLWSVDCMLFDRQGLPKKQ